MGAGKPVGQASERVGGIRLKLDIDVAQSFRIRTWLWCNSASVRGIELIIYRESYSASGGDRAIINGKRAFRLCRQFHCHFGAVLVVQYGVMYRRRMVAGRII